MVQTIVRVPTLRRRNARKAERYSCRLSLARQPDRTQFRRELRSGRHRSGRRPASQHSSFGGVRWITRSTVRQFICPEACTVC